MVTNVDECNGLEGSLERNRRMTNKGYGRTTVEMNGRRKDLKDWYWARCVGFCRVYDVGVMNRPPPAMLFGRRHQNDGDEWFSYDCGISLPPRTRIGDIQPLVERSMALFSTKVHGYLTMLFVGLSW